MAKMLSSLNQQKCRFYTMQSPIMLISHKPVTRDVDFTLKTKQNVDFVLMHDGKNVEFTS